MCRRISFFLLASLIVELGGISVAAALPQRRDAHSEAECQKQVFMTKKRASCLSCIAAGGVFNHRPGEQSGSCRGQAQPTPQEPPVKQVPMDTNFLRTSTECRQHVQMKQKLKRCRLCVAKGLVFNYQPGGILGFCVSKEAVKSSLTIPSHVIQATADCQNKVNDEYKRRRCLACVQKSGYFDYRPQESIGLCYQSLLDVPHIIRTATECRGKVESVKKGQCLECVDGGGYYRYKPSRSFGYCKI